MLLDSGTYININGDHEWQYCVSYVTKDQKGREGGKFCSRLSEKLCFETHGKDDLWKITDNLFA